ncbi:MAG TPA: hypothetical protein VM452_14350, partial [Caulifigura sp.]|nr:hypothetical protein [Caulifigura sp.]
MNAGKPPSRDWRAQPPAQSAYAREWRGGPADSKSRLSKKSRVRLLVVAIAVVIGLIGILLAPIADTVPQTQIVAFGIGSYGGRATPTGNMPVNPFGENDAKAFLTLSERFPDQFLPVRQEDNALSGAQLLSFLEQEAQSPAVAGKNLIVFCTLHALVQPSGNIELFAIDATPDSPSATGGAMVPLDDVVDRLRKSVARRVVLAVDASRLQSDWRVGILANDVASQAVANWPVLKASAAPASSASQTPVAILLAAGPGQASWPEQEKSQFAAALIAGLAGEADGATEASTTKGPQDRRVTLHELAAFLRQRVASQVSTAFGASQSVQFINDTFDYPLAVVAEPKKIDKAPAKEDKEKEKGKPAEPAAAVADSKTPPAAAPADGKDAKQPPPPKPVNIDWNARLAE